MIFIKQSSNIFKNFRYKTHFMVPKKGFVKTSFFVIVLLWCTLGFEPAGDIRGGHDRYGSCVVDHCATRVISWLPLSGVIFIYKPTHF